MREAVSLALLALTLSSWASAEYSAVPGAPISPWCRVSFPDGSARFQPPSDVVDVLTDVKDAPMGYVSGRTSTSKPSARDEALAFARAAAARIYLIERGVSPHNIMANYVSAANYIEDNSTVAGRLANQRVDIELIFAPHYLASPFPAVLQVIGQRPGLAAKKDETTWPWCRPSLIRKSAPS